jgi:hypothetical protein
MARTIYLVFGSPASPEFEDEVQRWYEPHLEQMATLPGIASAQFYRPSDVQLPRLKGKLPRTLGLYEYDTEDLAGDVEALWSSHLKGTSSGDYEAGRSITPPREGTFELDEQYESAYYELVSEYPPRSR